MRLQSRIIFSLLIAGLILSSPSFAAYNVDQIRIEGIQRVSEERIRQEIQIQVGHDLGRRDVQLLLREDVRRIARVEGVKDVTISTEPTQEGLRLIYEILEYPIIADLRFSGNRRYDDARLRRELEFTKRTGIFKTRTERIEVFYSPQRVKSYKDQIEQLYQQQGFGAAQITHRLEDQTADSVVVRFEIKEGKKLVIRGTRVEGNTAFKAKELIKKAKLRAKSSWVPFLPKKYDQLEVDDDVLRLTRFYEDAGYYRVKVRQGENIEGKKGRAVTVVFVVEEGQVYDIGQVQFSGNRIFADAELTEGRYDQPGARFSRSELEKDTYDLGEVYRAQGYIYTQVQPVLSARDEETQVDLAWEISESRRYRLGEIRVEGLVELDDGTLESVPLKTKEFVIVREFELESGDVLDWTKVRRSERRLLNLGYFKKQEEVYPARLKFPPQPEAVEDATNVLDLRLRLEEEPTGLITFGGGFSTAAGASVFGNVQERNLFGRGWRANVSATLGTRRQAYVIGFTDPHLFNSDYLFGVDLYRRFREAYGGREFDETRTGGALRIGKEIAEDLRATLKYKLEEIDIGDIDRGGLRDTIRPEVYIEDTSITSSLEFALVHDTRDYIYNPSRGHRYAGSLEIAGLGGDNEYWKIMGNASWYHLLTKKLILALDVEAGWAQAFGGTDFLPLHERFFAGGADSIRGFDEGGVGPQDLFAVIRRTSDGSIYSDIDDVAIGGELEWLTRTELRYPITEQIQGVVFVDTGAVWEETDDIDLGELRISAGVGLRISLPIGAAIRLDLGYPLKKEDDDDTQVFHFGFNQSF